MSARDVIVEVICGKYLSPSEGTYDKADDILRALGAAGYVVVPQVPTAAMIRNGEISSSVSGGPRMAIKWPPAVGPEDVYEAMIRAAKE